MRRYLFHLAVAFSAVLLYALPVLAEEPAKTAPSGEAQDITKEVLVGLGPGVVNITTKDDILMSFGGLLRFIPTLEDKWDFGMSEKVPSFLGGGLTNQFFKTHSNESGQVNNNYIRSEDRLYFNALPKDRKWSFYAALEFDRPLETTAVDNRGGKTESSSNFGLERLHGTFALPYNVRLHAGWDVWGLDFGEAASMVYGDDNPGFWLTGEYGALDWSVGYFKLSENNFQISPTFPSPSTDADRDLYAGYVNYKFSDAHRARFFYALDQIRSVPARDLFDYVTLVAAPPLGLSGGTPKTDSHHIGAYYIGTVGALELFAEGVYQFGKVSNTTYTQIDFDIAAYALSADLTLDLKSAVGFTFKPHLGVMYTTGDDDPADDKLNGYMGVENAQRFSQRWGGENTIIGDTNVVLGTALYGYLPEFYGNGTPVFTGGLQNFQGLGGGRGDNPGMTMVSFGLTVAPKKFIIYRTNANYFRWNEDFKVQSYSVFAPGAGTNVSSGYVGTEWDNELTLALSKYAFIKGQASFFFPGTVIEKVTEALGAKSDDMAMRLAMEFILNF